MMLERRGRPRLIMKGTRREEPTCVSLPFPSLPLDRFLLARMAQVSDVSSLTAQAGKLVDTMAKRWFK